MLVLASPARWRQAARGINGTLRQQQQRSSIVLVGTVLVGLLNYVPALASA